MDWCLKLEGVRRSMGTLCKSTRTGGGASNLGNLMFADEDVRDSLERVEVNLDGTLFVPSLLLHAVMGISCGAGGVGHKSVHYPVEKRLFVLGMYFLKYYYVTALWTNDLNT